MTRRWGESLLLKAKENRLLSLPLLLSMAGMALRADRMWSAENLFSALATGKDAGGRFKVQ